MKISCAVTLLAIVASTIATSSPSSEGQKSAVVPSSAQQSPVTSYSGPTAAQFPAQSYQFSSEYNYNPFAKSTYAAKSAAVPASSFGSYQPYQQQQPSYNYGPYQQQSYFPASGYPSAAVGSYPTVYPSQSTGVASYPSPYSSYPTPYSSYPYSVQPYHGAAAYPSYPGAYQPYNSQYIAAPASSPYNNHYTATGPSVTPYSAIPSAYQHQQVHPSFYSSTAAGQPYSPSQQFQQSSQQYSSPQQYQYPSFYNQHSPATVSVVTPASDSANNKVSAEKK